METVEMQTCRMCFVLGNCHMNIFNAKATDFKIMEIIAEHFQCELSETDLLPNYICFECWSKTESFHEFHLSVKSAQNDYLAKLIKLETKNEELKCEANSQYIEPWPDAQADAFNMKSSFVECNVEIDEPLRKELEISEVEIAADNKKKCAKKPLGTNLSKPRGDTKSIESKILQKYFDMACDMCPAHFGSFQQAQSHYLDEHNTLNGYIKCCQIKFKLLTQVRDHISWHLNPEIYRCNLCAKILKTKLALRLHIRAHAAKGNKPFICDICGKGFTRKETLRVHILAVHEQHELKFECEICKKRFPVIQRLRSHIGTEHRSVDEICEVCGKSCKTKSLLRAHLLTHSDQKSKPRTQCKHCGEWLQSPSSIHYHKQLHTSGPQKCNQCNVEVPNRMAMLTHVRSYHKIREHKCNFCEKAYVTAYKLKEHLETHTGQGSYQCAYCPMVFKIKHSLKTHRRRTHSIEWKQDRVMKITAQRPIEEQI